MLEKTQFQDKQFEQFFIIFVHLWENFIKTKRRKPETV